MSSHRHWARSALKYLLVISAIALPSGVMNPHPAFSAPYSVDIITWGKTATALPADILIALH